MHQHNRNSNLLEVRFDRIQSVWLTQYGQEDEIGYEIESWENLPYRNHRCTLKYIMGHSGTNCSKIEYTGISLVG